MSKDKITVNGVEYVPAQPAGKRAVVVVDRGWIFAGDVEEIPGGIRLTRAVHVFGWTGIGFAAAIEMGKGPKTDIRPLSVPVEVPAGSIIFRVPVGDSWGF